MPSANMTQGCNFIKKKSHNALLFFGQDAFQCQTEGTRHRQTCGCEVRGPPGLGGAHVQKPRLKDNCQQDVGVSTDVTGKRLSTSFLGVVANDSPRGAFWPSPASEK